MYVTSYGGTVVRQESLPSIMVIIYPNDFPAGSMVFFSPPKNHTSRCIGNSKLPLDVTP